MNRIDVHDIDMTVEILKEELRVNPSRLEEKKVPNEEEEKEEVGKEDDECEDGMSPLTAAAKFDNVAVVKFLLSVGANVKASNKVAFRIRHCIAFTVSIHSFKITFSLV